MTRRQSGFGLVETLLTLGALSALSLGIYLVLSPASAAAKAKVEQDNLRNLSTAVDRSFGLLGNFQGVSASRVVEDGLAPTRMVDGSTLRTAWGTSVTIAPHAVNVPADGFAVVYPFAPADVCPRLAAAVARDAYDIRVEGVSVYDGGELNPSATAAACGQADTATMEFVYHSGLVAGSAVAASPLVLPLSNPSVSVPTSAPLGAPVGPAGPVGPAVPVGPVNGTPPVTPAPVPVAPTAPATPVIPTTPPVPLAPSPVVPPSSVAACQPRTERHTDQQRLACPSGQVGAMVQERTGTQSYACPEAWAAPVASSVVWGGWATISSSCAPACSAPSPSSVAITRAAPAEIQNVGCPAGQVGAHMQQRSRSESGTRTTSWTCPGPTSSTRDTWSGTYTATGGWVTTSNTCAPPIPTCATPDAFYYHYNPDVLAAGVPAFAHWNSSGYREGRQSCWAPPSAPACSAPASEYFAIIQPASDETRNAGCPAGQTVGSHMQARSRTEHGQHVRTWSCPSPTGSPVASGANQWFGTYTYGEWTTTSNTCRRPGLPGNACGSPCPGGGWWDEEGRCVKTLPMCA